MQEGEDRKTRVALGEQLVDPGGEQLVGQGVCGLLALGPPAVKDRSDAPRVGGRCLNIR
ncbi:hypothetical protein [Streptomyces auratus]|uniref:Uncharacterized protein n=1 Tax=Streptomyces auratus AGR0001 TaxID=1160718 RepID=A0A8B1P1U8_9ACTN|nr:hypothetical protein [Streptomyces auratus]QTZ95760.1 hypothetical protein SU9_033455 [Streptomyces auratus AGR0001]